MGNSVYYSENIIFGNLTDSDITQIGIFDIRTNKITYRF